MTHRVIEMKSSMDELHSRLDVAKGKMASGSEENVQEAVQGVKAIEGLREKFRACCTEGLLR